MKKDRISVLSLAISPEIAYSYTGGVVYVPISDTTSEFRFINASSPDAAVGYVRLDAR